MECNKTILCTIMLCALQVCSFHAPEHIIFKNIYFYVCSTVVEKCPHIFVCTINALNCFQLNSTVLEFAQNMPCYIVSQFTKGLHYYLATDFITVEYNLLVNGK